MSAILAGDAANNRSATLPRVSGGFDRFLDRDNFDSGSPMVSDRSLMVIEKSRERVGKVKLGNFQIYGKLLRRGRQSSPVFIAVATTLQADQASFSSVLGTVQKRFISATLFIVPSVVIVLGNRQQ